MSSAKDAWTLIYGGGRVFPFAMRVEDVDIRAIARSLSRPRWLNHTALPITISDHSSRVGLIAEAEAIRRGLPPEAVRLTAQRGHLHDCGESVFPDMPGPIKRFAYFRIDGEYVEYGEAERRFHDVALEALGVPVEIDHEIAQIVDWADLVLLATEKRDLVPWPEPAPWGQGLPAPLPGRLVPLSAEDSERAFLYRWRQICPDAALLDRDLDVFGNCFLEPKTYRRINPQAIENSPDPTTNEIVVSISLPKAIAGAPLQPVWEDPDAAAYRAMKGRGGGV